MVGFLLSLVGIALIVIGVVALVSPIPIGIIFIGLGVSILVCVNAKAREIIKSLRGRHTGLNDKLLRFEAKIENRLHRLSTALVHTRPLPKDNGNTDSN